MAKLDLSIAIGGAAGQGIATPGDILARIFVRRGLHLNAYNAYQSIVRGGHIFLTLRTSDEPAVLRHRLSEPLRLTAEVSLLASSPIGTHLPSARHPDPARRVGGDARLGGSARRQ